MPAGFFFFEKLTHQMECKRQEIKSLKFLIKKNSTNPLKIVNVLQAYRVIKTACQSQPDIQIEYYLKSRTKFYNWFFGFTEV